jgi:tetraacyldisaccharide 4'-kinase
MWLATHWDRFTPVSALLSPLSLLFRAAVALRRSAYATGIAAVHRLPVPVIVVGNVNAGGTGKTPAVLWLARHLREHGYRPGIVSRGHGGTHAPPGCVTADSDPRAFGDEPVLLARRSDSPVWTGVDRAATARALLAAEPACNVLVSDDGLQHYGLGRDLEICVLDGSRGLGNGWLLPAGPLREPPSRLATVDAIVVNGGAGEPGTLEAGTASHAEIPRFRMTLEGREFYNLLNRGHRIGPDLLRGRRLHAVAGIGNPERFFRHLQALGLDFVAHAFPDHYPYRAADIDYGEADAIVMTEKDAVKCQAFAADAHWVLPVDAAIDDRFGEFVLRRLKQFQPQIDTDEHR